MLPLSYSHSLQMQHLAIRTKCGLTDMSGIRKILVKGKQAQWFLDSCVTRNCYAQEPGTAVYTGILDADGNILDDAILFRLNSSHTWRDANVNSCEHAWLICFGAGRGFAMLRSEASKFDVQVIECQNLHCLMIQGPKAASSFASVLPNENSRDKMAKMKRFEVRNFDLAGHPVLVARVSYSGEDGFEIFCDYNVVTDIWDLILGRGVPAVCPVAFGALDMMRIEAGLLIFGQDMTGVQTPREVGLDFVVDYNKPEFLGKECLLSRNCKLQKCLVGFQSSQLLSIANRDPLRNGGEEIGQITSCGYSQWLKKTIGFAHVTPKSASPGTTAYVNSAEGIAEVTITNRRFYQNLSSN